jgi:hypothetical protein
MLRFEFEDIGDMVIMRLQGRFVGPFAKDTKDLVTRCKIPPRLVVNLSEVTFVDTAGEEILSWLARIGGRFIADNLLSPARLRTPAFADGAENVPGTSAGRANAFADVLEVRWRVNGQEKLT